jgi:hypothetical protein
MTDHMLWDRAAAEFRGTGLDDIGVYDDGALDADDDRY